MPAKNEQISSLGRRSGCPTPAPPHLAWVLREARKAQGVHARRESSGESRLKEAMGMKTHLNAAVRRSRACLGLAGSVAMGHMRRNGRCQRAGLDTAVALIRPLPTR